MNQDVRISNSFFNKIKVTEYVSVFFSVYGICLSILLYEMKDHSDIAETRNTVLVYNVFCTLALMLSIYFRYDLYLKWTISRRLLTEYDTLWNTGWWKQQIFEQFIVIIAPYPYLYEVTIAEYNS